MQDKAQFSYHRYVDPKGGTVDRRIFSDPDIYQRELEHIFARSWNFMCHESQIPEAGDYFTNYIGDEPVICVRDRDGSIHVMLNSCPHRGNTVCRAESGKARGFLCSYHGWAFGLDGSLKVVPGRKDLYNGEIDREKWGLLRAPHVATYSGFVFACMDEDAPPLEEFLGEVGKLSLNLIAARGDMVCIDGVQKNVLDCNWKLAVENLLDWYHADITHHSATMAGFIGKPPSHNWHRTMLGEYGHALSGPRMTEETWAAAERGETSKEVRFPEAWRNEERAREMLGPIGRDVKGHPNVFPNVWITASGRQICLRLPKGPEKTELWWFTFVDRGATPEYRAQVASHGTHSFGPAGLLEQDDGDNWIQGTKRTRGVLARKLPFNYQMNLGHGQPHAIDGRSVYIDDHTNEHAHLWLYRSWADWMDAESWPDLKANATPVPTEAV